MLFFSACALCATLALAPSPSPAPSALPDIAHVYTADRSDETVKNATRTTYAITRDQIARYGYRTVGEALQSLPAVNALPYGPLGASVNYGIRGSSTSQVLVLVDGLPAPGSLDNSVELGNVPTTGVDRIEVVEGGGSTLYGTGAIGGIINIITDRSSQTSATLAAGSFGEKRLEVNTDHVQFSRTLAGNAFGLPGGKVRPDSDYASSAIHVNGSRRVGSFDVTLRAGLVADRLGAPGFFGFESPSSREDDLNGDANLTGVRKAAQSETTLQFGGTRQQITFACDAANDPNCFQPAPSLSTEGRFDFSARNVVSGANEQLLYGVDLSRGTVRSDSGGAMLSPSGASVSVNTLAQAAAYVQHKVDASWGDVYYGMRAERDGSLGGEFSPSAGVLVRLSHEATFKANIATAFRAPNASELYFPGYGNALLSPERAKVADLSVTDSRVLGGATLGWFTNRTNNLIVPTAVKAGTTCIADPASFTYEPCNVDRAFIQGFTLDMRTPRHHGFTTALNLTDLYRARDLDAQTRLPNQPVMSANLRLDYTGGASSVLDSWGVWMHVAGARGFVDTTQPLFYQPAAYTSVNAYARVRAGRDLLLGVRGYNLGNERFAAIGGFPMPGRSFTFEVSTK
ncbi:MAG TPA: TonB-dependent receptor [Candidatus Baltobacteraceae bacterium]|nr:TonB-dependent receptor [Candidatus Baltobacteraceae bacterium]